MKTLGLSLLLLVTSAFAQTSTPGPQPWVCDNATQSDDQGNPCLNFTTLGKPYAQVTGYTLLWDTEDGQPIPAPTFGAMDINYGNLQLARIANDPLITFFGYVPYEGVVSAVVSPTFPVNHTSVPAPDGGRDDTYVFVSRDTELTNICNGGQCIGFSWQGTWHLHWLKQPVGCRYGRCYVYHPGVGYGELSAVPVVVAAP